MNAAVQANARRKAALALRHADNLRAFRRWLLGSFSLLALCRYFIMIIFLIATKLPLSKR